jgi:formylglycine-generating enzyme required for sulfatase activity
MKKILSLLFFVLVGQIQAQKLLIDHASVSNQSFRIGWRSAPGQSYNIYKTRDILHPSWTNITPTGIQSSNLIAEAIATSSDATTFFRLGQTDQSPPEVVSVYPELGAVGVPSRSIVSIELWDQSDIEPSSVVLDVGRQAGLTVASSNVYFSGNTLIYQPDVVLGTSGESVYVSLRVADMQGYVLDAYTWHFRIERDPQVSTNTFIALVAPSQGVSIQADGQAIRRTLNTVRPASGTVTNEIVSVTTNQVIFAYSTGAPPIENGSTLLVSFDAAYPFYRRVLSYVDDSVEKQITAQTEDVPLSELLTDGSLHPSRLEAATGGASVAASLDLLEVVFGEDLSGRVLYEENGVKLHLPSGAWSYTGKINVAWDMFFGRLRSLETSASGDLQISLTPELIFSTAISDNSEIQLTPTATRTFGGMAGPVPVWVDVSVDLFAGVAYSAEAAATAQTTIDISKESVFKIRLQDNKWSNELQDGALVMDFEPITWQVEGSANAVIYLRPQITVLAYSLAGMWVDLKPYVEADGDFQVNPLAYQTALYAGVSSTLGIESRIWYDAWGDKPSWKLFDFRKTLWSTHYPAALGGAPYFVTWLKDEAVREGQGITLYASAEGIPKPSYQWYFNGSPIPGETSDNLSIESVIPSITGDYTLEAYNEKGSATETCNLSIETIPEPPLPDGFILVPGGTRLLGDLTGVGWPEERPVHPVTLNNFYLGSREVTNQEMSDMLNWALGQTPALITVDIDGEYVRNAQGDVQGLLRVGDLDCGVQYNDVTEVFSPVTGKANWPCVEVSWYGAAAYCNFLSLQQGRSPFYDFVTWEGNWNVDGFRLPTEAEWEYAAAGGNNGADTLYAGSDQIDSIGWYIDNSSSELKNVGQKMPNELGLHDMTGNASEWVNDWYSDNYYSVVPEDSPKGVSSIDSVEKAYRGGSFSDYSEDCRIAARYFDYPYSSFGDTGFRVLSPSFSANIIQAAFVDSIPDYSLDVNTDSDNFFLREYDVNGDREDHENLDIYYEILPEGTPLSNVEIVVYKGDSSTVETTLSGATNVNGTFKTGENLHITWTPSILLAEDHPGFYRLQLNVYLEGRAEPVVQTSIADADPSTPGWQCPQDALAVHDLMWKHRPIIHVHPADIGRPSNTYRFLLNATTTNHLSQPGTFTKEWVNEGLVTNSMFSTMNREGAFLDLFDDNIATIGDIKTFSDDQLQNVFATEPGAETVYHTAVSPAEQGGAVNFSFLQFWMFYNFSRRPFASWPTEPNVQHEGDLEHCQIAVRLKDEGDSSNKVKWVIPFGATASQHYYAQTLRWDLNDGSAAANAHSQAHVEHGNNRLVVYVALGAHATYLAADDDITVDEYLGSQRIYEEPGTLDFRDRTQNSEPLGYVLIHAVEDQIFSGFRGRWGFYDPEATGPLSQFEQGVPGLPRRAAKISADQELNLKRFPIELHNRAVKDDQRDEMTIPAHMSYILF